MKRLACLGCTLLMLSGCGTTSAVTDTAESATAQFDAELTEADNSEDTDEFTQDDFVLYADDDPVIWLGMTRDDCDEYSSTYNEYYQEITDIEYNTQNRVEDGEAVDGTVDYISLITYMGGTLKTKKGIGCVSEWNSSEDTKSVAEDVISAYGLDLENEKVYVGEPTDDNYTIALFFDIDANSKVTRVIVPKDSDIDLNNIEDVRANYYIKFMITMDEVSGIQLYRRKLVDA